MRFPIFYFILLLGDLLARQFQTEIPYLEYLFKPALMLSLGIYFYRQSDALKQGKVDYYMLFAIAFSWLGDILLMFDGLFILGLASFLLAHISYICAFLTDNKGLVFSKKDRIVAALIIVTAGLGFIFYLLPYLGSLKIPVVVYASTILTMLLATLNRWKTVRFDSFQWVFVGAIAFVISDGLLAVNKFAQPLPLSGLLIMLTYGVGQYLIVEGYLKKNKV
jgi:uncharacterized membrane protein YhhN